MHAVREFEGQLVLLELLENRRILTAGYSAVMHIHTAVEEVVITDLIAEQDRKTGEQKKHPRFVKSNSIVIARFTLSRPVCMETFDTMQQLGRFSLRDEGKTIAIGKVTKILNSSLCSTNNPLKQITPVSPRRSETHERRSCACLPQTPCRASSTKATGSRGARRSCSTTAASEEDARGSGTEPRTSPASAAGAAPDG